MMATPEIEYELLGNVLDALDDLYDQRERAEWWLQRLLVATGCALRDSPWERAMAESAKALRLILSGDGTDSEKNAQALAATGDLRLRVAERWAELWSPES